MKSKLRSLRGETLVEALCAVLVAALAAAVLAGMITSASHLNAAAIRNDDALYASATDAETFAGVADSGREVRVIVGAKQSTFSVDVYGDVVTSYKMNGG